MYVAVICAAGERGPRDARKRSPLPVSVDLWTQSSRVTERHTETVPAGDEHVYPFAHLIGRVPPHLQTCEPTVKESHTQPQTNQQIHT
jgi:hypothetical protein